MAGIVCLHDVRLNMEKLADGNDKIEPNPEAAIAFLEENMKFIPNNALHNDIKQLAKVAKEDPNNFNYLSARMIFSRIIALDSAPIKARLDAAIKADKAAAKKAAMAEALKIAEADGEKASRTIDYDANFMFEFEHAEISGWETVDLNNQNKYSH